MLCFVHKQEVEIFASSSALTNNLMKAVFNFVKVLYMLYVLLEYIVLYCIMIIMDQLKRYIG